MNFYVHNNEAAMIWTDPRIKVRSGKWKPDRLKYPSYNREYHHPYLRIGNDMFGWKPLWTAGTKDARTIGL